MENNQAKEIITISIPLPLWEELMNKIDNLTEVATNRNRAEFDNEYVDLEGARKILQYGTRKIEQFRKAGLPYYQWEQGGKIFYKRSDLQAWVERCRKVETATSDPIDLGIESEVEKLPFDE